MPRNSTSTSPGQSMSTRSLESHPWLRVCETVAEQQGFFHWELDFATVFARGGFDLQLGNPPWVRPRTDVDALLAEGDPWWQLALKPSEAARNAKREATLALPGIRDLVMKRHTDVVVTAEYLGSAQAYPLLAGLQPDLYRCFMEQTWNHASADGSRRSDPSRVTFHRRKSWPAPRTYIPAATSALAVHQ